MSLGHVDLRWLVAGVVLHLCAQLARGRGWHAVLCAAHPGAEHPRRRDVMLTWVAGAGASGVLSARGGDALKIVLMRRRMTTSCPTLVGTLAAETVAETVLGAVLTGWALGAGLVPGLPRLGLGTGALLAAGLIVLLLALRRMIRRVPALARVYEDVRRGLKLLGSPGCYLRRVASWGMLSRVLRIGALMCLLAAFSLPATLTAALVVMIAHSSGRLVPFGPAGAGASLGLLVAGFSAITHSAASAGRITEFYLGATGVLTAVGLVLAGLILVRELGVAGARRAAGEVLERLRVPRKAPARAPAA